MIQKNSESERQSELITRYGLRSHPEGGFYTETYRSDNAVLVDKTIYNQTQRQALTGIYYLLPANTFSIWHRVKSDEIWAYHEGGPIKIYLIDTKGELFEKNLGNPLKDKDCHFQIAIPAGYWQTAYNDSTQFSFVGCFVGPGFEYSDFELAKRSELSAHYPQHRAVIEKFTRDD
jgi:predicted cupin superfamily sugar epimerase